MDEIEDIVSVMENEFSETEGERRQAFEAQREELRNKDSEEYNVLKIQLETNIEDLEHNLEEAHKLYNNETEHRTRTFHQLSEDDASASRAIEMRTRKLQKLQATKRLLVFAILFFQGSLIHWRGKISTTFASWAERNKTLKEEKEAMSKHYRYLICRHFGGNTSNEDR